MSFGFQNCLLISLSLTFLSCASTREVSDRYKAAINDKITSESTTFVLLIDGLPVDTLKALLEEGKLPHLRHFFLKDNSTFFRARPVFPSLTYPNLISLITETPVEAHRIYGNKVFLSGHFLDFESPGTHPFLNEHIQGRNIFSRLPKKGLRTVAIGYNFWADATAATFPSDLEAGLLILDKKYEELDQKLVGSLEYLLKDNEVKKWPDFIFMHLIGLDFTSHDQGPKSSKAKNYLEKLDSLLENLLSEMEKAESSGKRKVTALLLADHGFSKPVSNFLNLENILPAETSVVIQNEGRMMSLVFPATWSEQDRKSYFEKVPVPEEIAFKATRLGNELWVETKDKKHRWSLQSTLTPIWKYPELTESLFSYFRSPDHPGMALVAQEGVGLTQSYTGFHGGISENEMTIPLLIRNGKLRDSSRLPYIFELLGFL